MEKFSHWALALQSNQKRPAYLMIADLIESDIERGALQARDRLPPLRELAQLLSLNYTTVTRAYKEASNRGLVDSHPGTGSFIRGKTHNLPPRNGSDFEMTMNTPPEILDSQLAARIREDIAGLFQNGRDLSTLFRYQDFGGTQRDKEAGAWLMRDLLPKIDSSRILVCPGIHSILLALTSLLCGNKNTLCVSDLVYPGLKAIAAQLGVGLMAMECDSGGPKIKSLESLCKTAKIQVLYINPTIQNPSTLTLSQSRREAIADLALRYNLTIIEDDAYGLVPEIKCTPIAALAPELTYYINGMAKCFGAGCRTAYLYAPSKLATQRAAGALRALSVMASPITNTLVTRWIQEGVVERVNRAQRDQSRRLQQIARDTLRPLNVRAHTDGFHLWLPLPKQVDTNPSDVAVYFRNHGISAVSSAAFCADNNPPEAIRLCLGGGASEREMQQQLELVRDTLVEPERFLLV